MVRLDRADEARTLATEAKTLFEQIGSSSGESKALFVIGDTYSNKKETCDEAIEFLEKARSVAEDAGDEGLSVKEVTNKIKEVGRFQKKKKSKSGGEAVIDIHINKMQDTIIDYLEYEGRATTTGRTGGSSRSRGPQPGDKDYVAPPRQKVMYNLRMQRRPNVDIDTFKEAIMAQ